MPQEAQNDPWEAPRRVANEHPEAPGVKRLQAKAQPKSKTLGQYNSRFRLLDEYCNQQSPPWDPYIFSLEMAYSLNFATSMFLAVTVKKPKIVIPVD